MLGGEAYRGSILVSHLHWDHVQGLPFFVAGDRPTRASTSTCPGRAGAAGATCSPRTCRRRASRSRPRACSGELGVPRARGRRPRDRGLHRARHRHRAQGRPDVRLPGRATGDSSIAYLPDHAVAGGVEPAVHELLRGVDVLLHDAQFVESERALADAYGHSTVDDAIALAAARPSVGTLVLFHHGPARTDDALDAIIAGVPATSLSVTVAAQGHDIGPSAHPFGRSTPGRVVDRRPPTVDATSAGVDPLQPGVVRTVVDSTSFAGHPPTTSGAAHDHVASERYVPRPARSRRLLRRHHVTDHVAAGHGRRRDRRGLRRDDRSATTPPSRRRRRSPPARVRRSLSACATSACSPSTSVRLSVPNGFTVTDLGSATRRGNDSLDAHAAALQRRDPGPVHRLGRQLPAGDAPRSPGVRPAVAADVPARDVHGDRAGRHRQLHLGHLGRVVPRVCRG